MSTKAVKHQKLMTGISSYYAEDFHGKLTANGEIYDMYGLTAAHKTLPLNTIVRVTNLDNNKSLILRINDRGPYVKGRILDCSYGAALKLGFIAKGTTKVKIEVIEFGDNKYMKHKS
ncbi:MAG: septal ring lytic transglycosylase RlpA family protein [Candidatus Marinimicrobia bacterium]|nr:septal ring lytic transglycosylase RlpA family protein [Candidatus Neomarinimicrobiota bacterium]MDP7072311.1 septal ring lytic transglycosylase RlpA family protein [Candidatus Neomarinimicrobiota bacterium]